MDLLPGPEQLELVSAAGDFLSERMPIERIRADRDAQSAVPHRIWREGAELGLLTLGLPEEFGGSGRPFDDEVLLHIELGRRLAPGPFLAATLAARVAVKCGDRTLAGQIGSGETLVTLAVLRGDGEVRPIKGTFDLFDPDGARYALVVGRGGAALADIATFGRPVVVESVDPGMRMATATVRIRRTTALAARRRGVDLGPRGGAVGGVSHRPGLGRRGPGDRIRQDTSAVRQADRRAPGHQTRVCGHGDRGAGRAGADVVRGDSAGIRPTRRAAAAAFRHGGCRVGGRRQRRGGHPRIRRNGVHLRKRHAPVPRSAPTCFGTW